MRIKKYQKIICLGLALISIMVLPCYAYTFSVTGLSYDKEYIFDRENVSSLFPDSFITKDGNNIFIKSFYTMSINIPENEYKIQRLRLFSTQPYYFMLMRDDLTVYINDVIIYPIDEVNITFAEGEESIKFYIYYADSKSKPVITYVNFWPNYYDELPLAGSVYIVDYVQQAVINITTYTNLLTQNFAKAFSFMTGPALAWVLLGISVSLISFGVYSVKRFL